ncbi:MAG: hypothetical protein K0M45_10635, partial [Candidatus Paracaedibacteraceae bacterium]|nr:hypothetical protein [Candidatus Paracaedibacteraceae bacterium]
NSQEGIITQEKSIFRHPLILSSHWTLVRLKILAVLRENVRRIACHLLIVSSLSLAWSSSLKAMEKDDPVSNLREFYKDKEHPLTQGFWKDNDLSQRLTTIRRDIESIKEQFINAPQDPLSELMKLNLGRYRDILTGFVRERCGNFLCPPLPCFNVWSLT